MGGEDGALPAAGVAGSAFGVYSGTQDAGDDKRTALWDVTGAVAILLPGNSSAICSALSRIAGPSWNALSSASSRAQDPPWNSAAATCSCLLLDPCRQPVSGLVLRAEKNTRDIHHTTQHMIGGCRPSTSRPADANGTVGGVSGWSSANGAELNNAGNPGDVKITSQGPGICMVVTFQDAKPEADGRDWPFPSAPRNVVTRRHGIGSASHQTTMSSCPAPASCRRQHALTRFPQRRHPTAVAA